MSTTRRRSNLPPLPEKKVVGNKSEGFIRLRGPVFFRMLASFALESHPANPESISVASAQAHAHSPPLR